MRADAQASAKVAWPCVRCLDWEVPRCHLNPVALRVWLLAVDSPRGIGSCSYSRPPSGRARAPLWVGTCAPG